MSDVGSAARPLAGTRVVQLGTALVARRLGHLLTEQGAEVVLSDDQTLAQLLTDADILVTAGDEDHIAPAGFGGGRLAQLHPRLIHCHIPAFPSERAGRAGAFADAMVGAELGLYRNGEGGPEPEPLAVPTGLAAILGAIHVVAALRLRGDHGTGQSLVVPMSSATLILLGQSLTRPLETEVIDAYNRPRLPIYDVYRCSDGVWILIHLPSPQFVDVLLKVSGRLSWRAEMMEAMDGLADQSAVDAWRERLAALFAERPAHEWEERITREGGGCTPCLTAREWREGPQMTAAGRLRSAAVTVLPHSKPVGPRAASGLHSGSDLPLRGIRVLDLGVVIAGPACGRTLGELGADVVKVDPPNRPPRDVKTWLDVSRGKRSVLLDLKQSAGREILWRLLDQTDVLIENFRAGKLDALGFDRIALAARNPRLVHVSMRAFGHAGPWEKRPGWEHSAQAATGMMLHRSKAGRPEPFQLPLCDYATGLLGALGVLLALIERDRTGCGGEVQCSLVQAAAFLLGTDERDDPIVMPTLDAVRSGAASIALGGSSEDVQNSGGVWSPIRSLDQLSDVDWLAQSEGIIKMQHPRLGAVLQAIARIKAGRYSPSIGRPAPDPGDDSASLLSELGYSPAEVDELLRTGAAAERPPGGAGWGN